MAINLVIFSAEFLR